MHTSISAVLTVKTALKSSLTYGNYSQQRYVRTRSPFSLLTTCYAQWPISCNCYCHKTDNGFWIRYMCHVPTVKCFLKWVDIFQSKNVFVAYLVLAVAYTKRNGMINLISIILRNLPWEECKFTYTMNILFI